MMNYQYIHQLLERYWECETTLEEEQILRSFFSQSDLPDSLKPYAPLFAYEHAEQHKPELSADFESRLMARIAPQTDQANRHVHFLKRLSPIMKAAAVVAVVVAVGNITERTLQSNSAGADASMTGTDTYIKKEDITATIKVIDQNKSLEAIARNDSTQNIQNR